MWKRNYVDEKTTAKLKTKPKSIAGVPYTILLLIPLKAPSFFIAHYTFKVSKLLIPGNGLVEEKKPQYLNHK